MSVPGPDRGLVRIHVVAEETGVPEPTLRAWERRYGIPTPERTSSGYRLYGPHEIQQVRQMRALCDAGVAAAEAAQRVMAAPEPSKDPATTARRALLDAVTKFDIDAFEMGLRHALFMGDPLEVVEQVIEPTLCEIGDRWHRGELSIAQEHFASHRIGMLLHDLLRLVPVAADAPRVLLASFADDDHELGIYALALRLSYWGWEPIILGARMPAGSLRTAIKDVDASVIGLSLTVTPGLGRARELIEDYAAACGETPWVVGGSGVAPLEKAIRAAGGLVAPTEALKLRSMFGALRRKAQ